MSLLIVDDEPAIRRLMARWAVSLGVESSGAENADAAVDALRTRPFDVVITDMMMPGRNGLWLAGHVRRDYPRTAVVIATGHPALAERARVEFPIADFLSKPFERDRFALAIDRGVAWSRQAGSDQEWHMTLARELGERVAAIQEKVVRRAPGITEAEALLSIAGERIPDVASHGERVARYAMSVARELGLEEEPWETIEQSARFHDIGKAAIPESLLMKPAPLTPGEIAIMQRHVQAGAEILGATQSLSGIAPIVRATHEWFGGAGYPDRLDGERIPLVSRIIAVVDAYDAMTEDRCYRARLDSTRATSELQRCAPVQFDPRVMEAFLAVLARQ